MKIVATVYPIEGPWKGQLAIVPRPRGEDWLEDEVGGWQEAGLDVIVSLLKADEARELGLNDEAVLAQARGLKFLEFPIPDYGVPSSFEEALRFVERLDDALTRGQNIGIHCRQGIGRSSLIAASVLVLRGIGTEMAFTRVAEGRGRPVPDTEEQREWITKFEVYAYAATTPR